MRVRLVKVGVYRGRIDDFIGYIIATKNHYEYDISSCTTSMMPTRPVNAQRCG